MAAVTGLGVMSPHGDDPQAMFDALMRGESAVRPVLPELARPAAAATVAFDPAPWFTKLQLSGVDRVSQLAVAAADRAWLDAGWPAGPAAEPLAERIGVYVGCGMGGAGSLDQAYATGARSGRVPPLTIPAFMPNAAAGHVAMRRRVHGPVLTYAVACASSAVALAEAAKAVDSGEVDVAIAGGTEALIVPGVVMAWQALGTLAYPAEGDPARGCRPFAADRAGFVLGEGAAFMILERQADAQARGAAIRADLAGWGLSCDATHLTAPDAGGQARALRAALRRAGLAPSDVGYCNAHGTATKVGDLAESEALRQVWGPALDGLRVSSTKALHGHLLGGAGALEGVITVLALQQGRLPPNAHGEAPDPACGLNLVGEPGTEVPDLAAAVSNSFAFGGSNAVLAFRRA